MKVLSVERTNNYVKLLLENGYTAALTLDRFKELRNLKSAPLAIVDHGTHGTTTTSLEIDENTRINLNEESNEPIKAKRIKAFNPSHAPGIEYTNFFVPNFETTPEEKERVRKAQKIYSLEKEVTFATNSKQHYEEFIYRNGWNIDKCPPYEQVESITIENDKVVINQVPSDPES